MGRFPLSSTNRSGKIECDVLLTNRCNLSCRHCLYIEHNPQKMDLATNDFEELLTKLEGTGSEVHLLGGEPLCRQDIVEIVREISRRGLIAKMLTNGFALSKKLLFELKEAGLQAIGVSIDGTKEAHNVNRGSTQAYERVMDALEMIKDFGFESKVSCAIHSENKDSLCSLLLELEAKGVNRILIEHVLPIGRGRQLTGRNLTPGEWSTLIDEIHKLKSQRNLAISVAIQDVFLGESKRPFICKCTSGKYPVLDELGFLYPCIILYAAGAYLCHISAGLCAFSNMREQIIGFISSLTSPLPQPYMYGKMEIKCPAVQLLVANKALNLDNIMDSCNVIGCFHSVLVI